jgi:polysaccharide export outer membrane protein
MFAAGCADLGPYVWADALPLAPPATGEYRLAPGDTINVRVFNQESVSGKMKIRPDGRITVPFIEDVAAAGQTTQELTALLQARLRNFLNQPVVTVSVEEIAPARLSVLGEVARPGNYSVERGQGVLRAIAAAGGLTEFAHKDRIFVVRTASGQRIRFKLHELSVPGTPAARFGLADEDVVLVQ